MDSTQKTLNIYFIHAKHLSNREKLMEDFKHLIKKYNFINISKCNIHTIEKYDPNSINMELVQKTVNYSPIKDGDESRSQEEKQKGLEYFNGALKNLHVFQLSNTLKHYEAMKLISENDDNSMNIVLEDDILYEERILLNIERVLKECDNNYSMIFLGLPSNIRSNGKHIFQDINEVYRVLPYCDSYLISRECAKKMYQEFLPIKWVGNIQLSYLIEKLKINAKITVPNLFMDGSKFGIFLSTLNPNNQLVFNNDYMTVLNGLNKSPLDKTNLEKIFAKSQIAQNPDFMYLHAKYLTKIKKYNNAEKVYETALKIYENNANVVNHDSEKLKDYIRLYKTLQNIVS